MTANPERQSHETNRAAIFKEWQQRGLTVRASNVLANYGINNVAELRALGRKEFLRLDYAGVISASQIEKVIGWEDPQPLELSYALESLTDMARVAGALERIAASLEIVQKAMLQLAGAPAKEYMSPVMDGTALCPQE